MEIKEIKVEVPEGYIARYDAATQTIKFIPDNYKIIKDFETACKVLGISGAIPTEIRANEQLCAMYKMQIVLKVVNQDYTFNLISGKVWYPYIRFIDKNRVDREINSNESKILDFNYEDRLFTLMGGITQSCGTPNGIGCYYSSNSIGYPSASISFFACCDEKRAHHVSKYFAALIFDCYFARKLGFSLSNGEMVSKNYSIYD